MFLPLDVAQWYHQPGSGLRGCGIVRIVVVGTAGAGKTTMAKALAATLAIPHVELDALHWDPGWQALSITDPDEFVRRVTSATAGDGWVVDGNYAMVREITWSRATHLVWLDYDRPVIMWRVIRRTFFRAVSRAELWSGNVEHWRSLLRPSHPIRWAWTTWRRRRAEFEALLGQQAQAHLIVLRVRRPAQADGVARDLTREATSGRR
ncbi:MAG TPA: adenylate kinase [Acetobacteraceae bacterium]|jgi:adenylate kinase family enzyme|nr:adenylate kinase [Acetobacteraceae bacterium]